MTSQLGRGKHVHVVQPVDASTQSNTETVLDRSRVMKRPKHAADYRQR